MSRLMRQLRLELAARLFETLLFPIQVSKAEVDFGLQRRCFYRGFELRRRLLGWVGGVEHVAQKHVNRSGIRVPGEQKPEFTNRILVRSEEHTSELQSL